jgi:hypothetical protein
MGGQGDDGDAGLGQYYDGVVVGDPLASGFR